jgi:hypothetical protein
MKQSFLRLLLYLLVIFGEPNLSKSAALFDLSELSASQQNQLWIQVDNWAVAVVLSNFCKQPTALEERMTKIANGCVTPGSIKAVVNRFNTKMDSVKGNVWNCADKTVSTFVVKTVAKADRLVDQAENACKFGSIYQQLLPFLH